MDNEPQTQLQPVKIFGKPGSALAYMIRDFLHRSDVRFEWTEVKDGQTCPGLPSFEDRQLPACMFADGTWIECATVRQITEKLGWFRDPSRAEYDLAIYGAGPAGLSAAVYGSSEGLSTIVVERWAVGGQASSSSKIENYLGFPSGVSGAELAERAREQASKFGAELLIGREGVRGEFVPGRGIGYLADGTKIIARSTICATGVEYRRLNLSNEASLLGAGVYYGAGVSEASLCRNQDVYVVGGGNSAGQAALHFSRFARTVTLLAVESSLASMSQYLIDRIRSTPNVTVLTGSAVTELQGQGVLEAITITDSQSAQERTVPARWLFICIGGVPHTDWAAEIGIERDKQGYLLTGPDLRVNGDVAKNWPLNRDPYYLETNMPGVFAAGDVRHGSVKRCASAVGEGAMAVTFVHRYLSRG